MIKSNKTLEQMIEDSSASGDSKMARMLSALKNAEAEMLDEMPTPSDEERQAAIQEYKKIKDEMEAAHARGEEVDWSKLPMDPESLRYGIPNNEFSLLRKEVDQKN